MAAQHTIDFGHARGAFHEVYPPGIRTLNYRLLKHIKPVKAHHGTMLTALRLITVTARMLVIVTSALLGSMLANPLTGLMAAAIWIVNPWVVERAHWALPDVYLTLFTPLAPWLALIGCLHGRRSISSAAVYSIMPATMTRYERRAHAGNIESLDEAYVARDFTPRGAQAVRTHKRGRAAL